MTLEIGGQVTHPQSCPDIPLVIRSCLERVPAKRVPPGPFAMRFVYVAGRDVLPIVKAEQKVGSGRHMVRSNLQTTTVRISSFFHLPEFIEGVAQIVPGG